MTGAGIELEETPDGLQVHFAGRPLYSPRPLLTARRKAEAFPVQSQTLYLVPSPVAWHGVTDLCSRLPPDSAVLAVEAEPLLLELARRLAPPERAQRRLLLCAGDTPAVEAALTALDLHRFRRVRLISFSAGARLHQPRYTRIRDRIEHEIRVSWQNRLTLTAMGRLWIRNLIRNLPLLEHAVPLPATGLPVMVCGAGPSLAATLPLIRDERRFLAVVAVDTALPVLDAAGISPDCVVAIEGQLANVYDFLPVQERSYTLIADITSAPAVLQLHDPGISWVSSRFAELPLLDRLAALAVPIRTLPPLGSVGVAAAALAFQMTGGPVLTTGLDFAVLPGATHAPSSPAHLRQLLSTDRRTGLDGGAHGGRWISRKGVAGPVTTTMSMVGYAEEYAALVRDRDVSAVEPFGLASGVRAVSAAEASTIIRRACQPAGVQPQEVAAGGAPAAPQRRRQLEAFVVNEIALLERFAGGVRATLAGAAPTSLESDYRECNYVTVDFPDAAGTLGTETRFLSRVLVAADYYRDRFIRTLTCLRS